MINSDTLLLHYNGRQFDLPFLKGRCQALSIPTAWDNCRQLDLYKSLRSYQKFLGLERLKLTDLEHYLKILRSDRLSGKECISIYRKYVLEKQSEQKKTQEESLLLHNQWDLIGLLQGTCALACPAFFQGQFRLEQCRLVSDVLTCMLIPDSPLPRPLSVDCSPKPWRIFGTGSQVQMDITLENGCCRMYYMNYKDYYYLPDEDTAIHKSVGAYVDKPHREQAMAESDSWKHLRETSAAQLRGLYTDAQICEILGIPDASDAEIERARARLERRHRKSQLTSGLCGIIMIAATMVGVALLLVPQWHTAYFWMAWVVGGLLCGVASIFVSTFVKDDPTA